MKASNVTELMLGDKVEQLLKLCIDGHSEKGRKDSDYDRFLRFCRLVPLFAGHPLQNSAAQYLKRYFDTELAIIPENAEKLWRLTAEQLLLSDVDIASFSIVDQADGGFSLPPLSDGDPYTSFLVLLLAQTQAQSWHEWREELQSTLDAILASDPLRILRIDLDDVGCAAQRPSLYHVEQALQKKKRTNNDRAILTAQLVRFVCEYAQATAARLTVFLHTPRAVELLAYCHKTVGLPPLLCTVCDCRVQDALIKLIQEADAPIRLALDYDAYASHTEFAHAAKALAKKFPLGCLTVLSDNCKKQFLLS